MGKEKNPVVIKILSPMDCLSLPGAIYTIEPPHDITNKMACAPSEASDQPGHPHILIRDFTVQSMGSYGPKLSSY